MPVEATGGPSQSQIDKLFRSALQHHQAGDLVQAKTLYRQILALQSEHAPALHYLGVIEYQSGSLEAAEQLMRGAIALQPDYVEAHYDLANVLKDKGQLDRAIAAYHQVIALNPNFAAAYNNLGNICKGKGQPDEAIAAYRQAIALRPDNAAAYSNLGVTLAGKGQLDEAIAAYRQAIALNPNLPETHNNLGVALKSAGQLDQAIAALHQAIVLRPNYPEASNNLGNASRDKDQLDPAIAAYRQALALRPAYAEAHNNLGNVLKAKGQLDEAIAASRRALALRPDYPEAHNNLGNALQAKGQLDEAIAAYQQALALRSDYAEAHNNLGIALQDNGQLDEAIAAYRQAIALRPNYSEACNNLGNVLKHEGQLDEAIAACRAAIAMDPDNAFIDSNLVLTLHYHPGYDAQTLAEEHRRWNRQHAEPLRQFMQPHPNDRDPDRRLRIGYVSPDFKAHPVGRFLLPLLARHDKQQVEVFAYSGVMVPDHLSERLRSHVDTWRNIAGLADERAVELIRQDRIDILVDLTMHTANNRLLVFARKPAPVQITYLAYCSSTGLETIDYRLSDPYMDPPGMDESIYSERTIRLPDTSWCYESIVWDSETTPLPALEHGYVTFGSLNNFSKISEPTLAVWIQILHAVPHSQLLLHAHEGSHRQQVRDRLQREGIDPTRLRFAGFMPTRQYFELYRTIDIGLDTFPFAGGTTTCDALWMGVPVISLAGKTGVGRGGVSILSNIGVPELIADSHEKYVRLARELAADLPRLCDLRSTLRQRMQQSPLMDGRRFASNVEAAYRRMWRTWCRNCRD